nr:MAG: hypothetical protein J07AB56_09590 [Candidatus Nanosalinarum sp. J07AB56]
MEITEEVVRMHNTIALREPERAYSEIRDLLERRMHFDTVQEPKYYNDVDTGVIRSEIEAVAGMDTKTAVELEIELTVSPVSEELDIGVKSKVVTSYPDMGPFNNLAYYAYLSLREIFLYGGVREEYEEPAEELAEEFMERVRQSVEVRHGRGETV